jgi:hypothetical protein
VTRLGEITFSPNGLLLERAISLDFATERGLIPDWDDIPADEYAALRVYQQERNKHESEQLDKNKPQR